MWYFLSALLALIVLIVEPIALWAPMDMKVAIGLLVGVVGVINLLALTFPSLGRGGNCFSKLRFGLTSLFMIVLGLLLGFGMGFDLMYLKGIAIVVQVVIIIIVFWPCYGTSIPRWLEVHQNLFTLQIVEDIKRLATADRNHRMYGWSDHEILAKLLSFVDNRLLEKDVDNSSNNWRISNEKKFAKWFQDVKNTFPAMETSATMQDAYSTYLLFEKVILPRDEQAQNNFLNTHIKKLNVDKNNTRENINVARKAFFEMFGKSNDK